MVLVVKNLSANAEDTRDAGSVPEPERSSGGGLGNPLQYSSLENPMDRGDWQATVYTIAVGHDWSNLSMHALKKVRSKIWNNLNVQ